MRGFKQFMIRIWYLSVILLLITYLSKYWWLFDLITSFKLQVAVGTLIVSLLILFNRYWTQAIIGVIASLVTLYFIYGQFDGQSTCPDNSARINIISANLLSSNTQSDLLTQYIQSDWPDILILLEYTSSWDQALSPILSNELPYNVKKIQNDNFGISLWSRFPLIDHEIFDITNSYFPMIEAQIRIESDTMTFVGLHLENPVGQSNSKTRRVQLQALIEKYRDSKNLAIIGDFNMTPYSADYHRLLSELNLNETRSTIRASFPSYFWPLMIPIDHCLIGQSIQCGAIKTGPNIGSDHLPLEIVISL